MGKKMYIKELAEVTGLTDYQLRRMTKGGNLPFIKSGNRYIYDQDLVEEALRNMALANIQPDEETQQYGKLRKLAE